ncbi:hypothetical protein BOTBODRAFT_39037 [Botryobasidium botryosum FD-172 SS1]|uniref:Uncharacterized protein n=1 Tax=Botryobasidium botryosum (strain FD-172 SS1) TaxID=930990 RepID=A0A067LV42_BOTB1|nr:hypothetical protein BOTBODRAFT_39037 [Botryobasidium botryosum FD-172 SS1]
MPCSQPSLTRPFNVLSPATMTAFSFLQSIFSCCFRSPEKQRDILDDIEDRESLIPSFDSDPLAVQRRNVEIYRSIVVAADGKMVDVQAARPFILRSSHPQTSQQAHSPSRTPSPRPSLESGDISMESEDRQVGPRMQVYMVDSRVGRGRKHGRGRERGQSEDVDEVDRPEVRPLNNADRELIMSLSSDFRKALDDGFRIRDPGQIVVHWETT